MLYICNRCKKNYNYGLALEEDSKLIYFCTKRCKLIFYKEKALNKK